LKTPAKTKERRLSASPSKKYISYKSGRSSQPDSGRL